MASGQADGMKPVLQLLEHRGYAVDGKTTSTAFRARLSDSVFSFSNCVGTQDVYNVLTAAKSIKPLVRVNSFTVSYTQ